MPENSIRWITLIEALALSTLIGVYIWQWQPVHPAMGWFLGLWFVVSIFVHHDTPKTLGWRGDNLWAATWQGMPVLIAFLAFTFTAAAFSGAYHQMPAHFTEMRRFVKYGSFCLLQQVALNSYLTNRLVAANLPLKGVCLLSGVVFGALHWPNPVLVPLTFVGGVVMAWLFIRERNIIPLAVGQALLGALVWWALPMAWHHGMRVGPGFYTFHLH
jgi:hypothetical protein